MRPLCYSITLILFSFFSFGQSRKESKNVEVSNILVGSWKMEYAIYNGYLEGAVFRDTSTVFHIDTIQFFSDRTFRFKTHDTGNTHIQTHTGNWEIAHKGKVLIHKNRQTQPPFEGTLPDLSFPIRMINADKVRINYSVYIKDSSATTTSNTPVFFKRIK